jgi:hypothetical protein
VAEDLASAGSPATPLCVREVPPPRVCWLGATLYTRRHRHHPPEESNLQGKRICILGLAFKAGTDDARLSPAVELARRLRALGASLVAYDPMASANAQHEVPELDIAPDPYVAAIGAHCVVIATEWAEFRHLDLKALREAVTTPILVDARNVLREDQGRAAGFAYHSMGRRPVQQHPGAPDLLVLPEPASLDAVADAAG